MLQNFSFLLIGKFDIIQCHFGSNGQLASILSEMGINGKVVTMFHGYDIRMGLARGPHIYDKLIKNGDAFLSISDYNYNNLIKFGINKNKIISHPVGINIKKFPYRNPNIHIDTIRIISVSRLMRVKGLKFGISAINKLIRERSIKNIKWDIVGEGPLFEDLYSKVNQLGLNDYIHFTGFQNQESINKLLEMSNIYFLPSVAEALPLVLMEALAVGLPVVATDVGSVKQLIFDGISGFIVKPRDEDEMANKLELLIKNPHLWEEMTNKGRAHIEKNYDINILNQKLVKIYSNLLN